MATNFPTSVDNFTNPTANDSLNLPSHSTQHANANDAIEAIEGYLLTGNGRAGLQHIVSTSFSATAGINIDNCFSASFDNYVIYMEAAGAGGATNVQYRWRQSGATITTTNFQRQQLLGNGGTASAARVDNTSVAIFGGLGLGVGAYELKIFKPFLNTTKTSICTNVYDSAATATKVSVEGNGWSIAGIYDGIRFQTDAGTMTGSVRIYGLRNS